MQSHHQIWKLQRITDFFTRSHSCIRSHSYSNPLFHVAHCGSALLEPSEYQVAFPLVPPPPHPRKFFSALLTQTLLVPPCGLASNVQECLNCSSRLLEFVASRILSSHLHKQLADPLWLFTRCGQTCLALSPSGCKPRLPDIVQLLNMTPVNVKPRMCAPKLLQ